MGSMGRRLTAVRGIHQLVTPHYAAIDAGHIYVMSVDDGMQLLNPVDGSLVNTSVDGLLTADTNETWSKTAFGDARLIFAVLPPPVVVIGVVVNVVLLVLTAARQDGLNCPDTRANSSEPTVPTRRPVTCRPSVSGGVYRGVNMLARQDGLHRHPTGVYVGALCVCFTEIHAVVPERVTQNIKLVT